MLANTGVGVCYELSASKVAKFCAVRLFTISPVRQGSGFLFAADSYLLQKWRLFEFKEAWRGLVPEEFQIPDSLLEVLDLSCALDYLSYHRV